MKCSIPETKASALGREAFTEQLGNLMPRLVHAVVLQERNALARGILTLPQFLVLMHLYQHAPCGMHTISAGLHLKASHVTGIMDRLVAMEMVRRIPSKRDRRMVLAAVRPRGTRAIKQIFSEKKVLWENLYEDLSAEDRRRFIVAFQRLLARVEAVTGNGGEPGS